MGYRSDDDYVALASAGGLLETENRERWAREQRERDEAAKLHGDLAAARERIEELGAALRPFADTYSAKADPGVSDLDNEQPMAWHVPLGAWRRARAVLGKKP